MTNFPQIGQATLESQQAGAEVTANTAFLALDTLAFPCVLSQETAPPGSPTAGDRHLVIATATGDFAGMENAIALYWAGAWTFYTPKQGWRIKDLETGALLYFDGTDWVDLPARVVSMVNAAVQWTNMPSALTEFRAGTEYKRRIMDLRWATQIRFASSVCVVAGNSGSTLKAMYSVDSGATWDYFDSDGADSGPSVAIDGTAGTPVSGSWVAIDAAAKTATTWVALFGLGGDGAIDPQFGTVEVEIR